MEVSSLQNPPLTPPNPLFMTCREEVAMLLANMVSIPNSKPNYRLGGYCQTVVTLPNTLTP